MIRGKHGHQVYANLALDEVETDHYGLLILPGGKAPSRLREVPAALHIVRQFFEQDKPVAAICHGPQILISAGLLAGRTATAYRSVADELRAAGAHYQDRSVVVDGNLITSRQPSDLDSFMRETLIAASRSAEGLEEQGQHHSHD
jgi:protease I